jgi:hypothetical protein
MLILTALERQIQERVHLLDIEFVLHGSERTKRKSFRKEVTDAVFALRHIHNLIQKETANATSAVTSWR